MRLQSANFRSSDQKDTGSVEGSLEEKTFPGGLNDEIETTNTEYYPEPVQIAQGKNKMIPGGLTE